MIRQPDTPTKQETGDILVVIGLILMFLAFVGGYFWLIALLLADGLYYWSVAALMLPGVVLALAFKDY